MPSCSILVIKLSNRWKPRYGAEYAESTVVYHFGILSTRSLNNIIKLVGHPENLPFPVSGSLAERRLVMEARERLDILGMF